MAHDPGPMVRRRQLGAALRHYRTEAGLTVTEVASRLLVAASKISRIENAQRNASVRDVRDLCDIYGITDEAVRDDLMELARGSRERAWWQELDLPAPIQALIGMEGSARRILEFEALLVPGLMQTPAYARAITPPHVVGDSARADGIIDARMRRQHILGLASSPQFDVILDEAVLHRIVGDRAVMRDQIDHLITMAVSPRISLRIIPFAAGAHMGMTGGFTILEFARGESPQVGRDVQSVAYVEAPNIQSYIDQPAEVEKFQIAYQHLASQAASVSDSERLLKEFRAL